MKKIIRIIFCFQLLLSFSAMASGNGSVGIGNGMIINIAIDSIQIADGTILDSITKEPLIKFEPVSGRVPYDSKNGTMVRSEFGKLNGFEYLPNTRSNENTNFWVVCPSTNSCVKMTPLSNKSKVMHILGSISQEKDK